MISPAAKELLYELAVRLGMDSQKKSHTVDEIYRHARNLERIARARTARIASRKMSYIIADRDRSVMELSRQKSELGELMDDNSRLRSEVANRMTVTEANENCLRAVEVWKKRAFAMRDAQQMTIDRLVEALREMIEAEPGTPESAAAKVYAEEILVEFKNA